MTSSDTLRFLSPSYLGDLDRFCLLRRSIRKHARCPVDHVVAVPRRDVSEFRRRLESDDAVRIVAQESVVGRVFYTPLWFRLVRSALGKYGWRMDGSRYAGRKGWIVQQIVKLSIPELFSDGPVAIVDSDLVFIRPFAVADLLPSRDSRLLLRAEPQYEEARQRFRMGRAREILRLAPGSTDHHYMAFPAIWYVDWVSSLRSYLEDTYCKPWQQVLFDAKSFSEYLLYGVFIEEILKPDNVHVRTDPFEIGIWHRKDFDALLSGELPRLPGITSEPLTLVVQSNIGMDVVSYAAAVERYVCSD